MAAKGPDGGVWDVAAYETFHDLRLRPALDLLARVSSLPQGDIVDLGCGAGAAAAALRARFPDHCLVGLDGSAEMLKEAAGRGLYDRVEKADIASWRADGPVALIYSNAALHWLDGHEALIPRLYGMLAPGGRLAIQMPSQLDRPSHRTMIAAAAEIRADLFTGWTPFPGHLDPGAYADLIDLAETEIWSTEYYQRLPPSHDGAHPVRTFSSATAGRPVLARLSKDEAAGFAAGWDRRLAEAYPLRPDGGVWFPFRRLFLVFGKPAP